MQTPPRGRAGSRVAFAAALTTFVLGTLASFGGVGYAAQGASNAVSAVKRVAAPNHVRVLTRSAASDQYGAPKQQQKQQKPPKPTSGQVAGTAAGKPKPPATPSSPVVSSGQLPFTGLSLVTTAVLGFTLVGLGLLLRRRERREG